MVEKQGKKIRAGVSPPIFGQCPKENIFVLGEGFPKYNCLMFMYAMPDTIACQINNVSLLPSFVMMADKQFICQFQ